MCYLRAMHEKYPFEYSFEGVRWVGIAWRADRPWGHALEIEIRDEEGSLLNTILFACHPEHPDFDQMQAKDTKELIRIAKERFSSGADEEALRMARKSRSKLVLGFTTNPGYR
jgi:hypothetical protein